MTLFLLAMILLVCLGAYGLRIYSHDSSMFDGQLRSIINEDASTSLGKQRKSTEPQSNFQLAFVAKVVAGCVAACLLAVVTNFSFGPVALSLGSAILIVSTIIKARTNRQVANLDRELELNLPIVLERLVMAVQSGLDITSAVQIVGSGKLGTGDNSNVPNDAVSKLLRKVTALTESGAKFEDSLEASVKDCRSTSVRHAFMHLAVAHRDGGELSMPLRELSDAVNQRYESIIEEEIAKMPVKATMPLVLTFAGLLICFITVPLLQVSKITNSAKSPSAEVVSEK